MNREIFKKADIIIYAAILLLAAAAFLLYFHLHKDTGDTVVVSMDGVEICRFPLSNAADIPSGPGTDEHSKEIAKEAEDSGSYSVHYDTDSVNVSVKGYTGGLVDLVIANGQADVTEADCPDHICVKHRPISRAGESIVCLPNRVVVTVENTVTNEINDVDGIDAVSR